MVLILVDVSTCVYLLLTFVLLSPDSAQLSLGETDEENGTKPHVQLTLLPPSPALFYSSLILLSSPVSPLTLLEVGGASLLHSPTFRRSLFASALPQLLFLHLSQRLLLFSLLCLSLFSALRTSLFGPESNFSDDGFVAGKQLTNSCVAE